MPHAPDQSFHRFITREQARALDRDAIEEFGIPGIVLMENAASELMAQARRMLAGVANPSVIVVCGTGNNGGDGFALARKLGNAGIPVECALIGDRSKVAGDARVNLTIAERMGIAIRETPSGARPTLVVDALFGTGLTRAIEGLAADAIEWINGARSSGAIILAVDVPSGMDADSGDPIGASVVRADATVTFVLPKLGFANGSSRALTGEVVVGSIGVPRALVERYAV